MKENTTYDSMQLAKSLRFLAGVLSTSPDVGYMAELRKIVYDAPECSGYEMMNAYWKERAIYSDDATSLDLRVDWTRLFRGVSPGYGPPPPYQYVYVSDEGSLPHRLLEMKQLYRSFGIVINPEQSDRPDFLGYQLEVAAILAENAGNAAENGDDQAAVRLMDSFLKFISGYLGWASEFCEQAKSHAQTKFYQGYLQVLFEVISELADENQ